MDEDFLLIQKMRMGNEKAVEAFVAKYYIRILKYCQIHLTDGYLSEDMTQETFIRFFGSLHNYHHYGKAANYLYVIAANVCNDYYRKIREIPVAELPAEAVKDSAVDLKLDIGMAFDALPQEIREVAILYFGQEQRQRDIAKILKIGLPLVKYRIKRSRELLREFLKCEKNF